MKVDELRNLDSCEHIWERGVGFAQTSPQVLMMMVMVMVMMAMMVMMVMMGE